MTSRHLIGLFGALFVLVAGGVLFMMLSMIMNGSDPKNHLVLAMFIGGTGIIIALALSALYVIWKWVQQ